MKRNQKDINEVQEWVEVFGDRLFRFAVTRVRDPSIAEDLVQNTFIAALKGKKQFRNQSSASTWLTGILKNQIADYYRKEKRYCFLEEMPQVEKNFSQDFNEQGSWASPPHSWKLTPEQFAQKQEVHDLLWQCIDKLPDSVRLTFISREIDGDKTATLCEQMNISASNLGVILHRARHAIRKCLSKKGL